MLSITVSCELPHQKPHKNPIRMFSLYPLLSEEEIEASEIKDQRKGTNPNLTVYGAFQGTLVLKNPPANTRDSSLIPGLGRSLGEGNGNPLLYSCLGNPMDRGAWWATAHRVAKESDTTKQLMLFAFMSI